MLVMDKKGTRCIVVQLIQQASGLKGANGDTHYKSLIAMGVPKINMFNISALKFYMAWL